MACLHRWLWLCTALSGFINAPVLLPLAVGRTCSTKRDQFVVTVGFASHARQRCWTQTSSAMRRFSLSRCLQLREALLEEIRLAALTLRESAKFSVGLASAISAHIHASLISNANLPGSRQFANQSMHLEHARLLEVEPLRALLSFLWIQLGLRWEILPCNQKAAELSLVSIHCSSPKLASF